MNYLGDVTSQVPGLPEGWYAWAWTDEIVFNTDSTGPLKRSIAQYPDVKGFFVVDWVSHSIQQDSSVPTIGPFTTLTAAIAAWKLIQ